MDLTKLSTPAKIISIVGLLAFIDSFLPWFSFSEKAADPAGLTGFSASGDAWNVGFGAWFPLLVLLALGVLAVLPAFGRTVTVRGSYAAIGAVALVATVIVALRWLTYPSLPADESIYFNEGASFGTYLGLLLGVLATAAAYIGFTAEGGSLNNIAGAFKAPAPGAGGSPTGDAPDGPPQSL